MAEEGTGWRGRGERGGRRKGPEREGEGRKREGPHDTLAWGPQCLNPALETLWRMTGFLKFLYDADLRHVEYSVRCHRKYKNGRIKVHLG